MGTGDEVEVFCEMQRFGGGWTRVADVDPANGCPGSWVNSVSPVACTRGSGSGILATQFDPILASYREIMGYVLGLQFGSMDSFSAEPQNVGSAYVDGVGLSVLDEQWNRVHVWTYAVAWSDDDASENTVCPCLGGNQAPDFVGTDFFCESGRTGGNQPMPQWYVSDPLWDGDGTGTDCNTDGDPSYFVKELGFDTDSEVEARLIADQDTDNEDVGVTRMELFVR